MLQLSTYHAGTRNGPQLLPSAHMILTITKRLNKNKSESGHQTARCHMEAYQLFTKASNSSWKKGHLHAEAEFRSRLLIHWSFTFTLAYTSRLETHSHYLQKQFNSTAPENWISLITWKWAQAIADLFSIGSMRHHLRRLRGAHPLYQARGYRGQTTQLASLVGLQRTV